MARQVSPLSVREGASASLRFGVLSLTQGVQRLRESGSPTSCGKNPSSTAAWRFQRPETLAPQMSKLDGSGFKRVETESPSLSHQKAQANRARRILWKTSPKLFAFGPTASFRGRASILNIPGSLMVKLSTLICRFIPTYMQVTAEVGGLGFSGAF